MSESEGLQRIIPYATAFFEAVDRLCRSSAFNAADYQDTYNRLNRLRDRYLHEKANLLEKERDALSKVFENDQFIKGLLNLRQIGEHVERRDRVEIRLLTNAPITLPVLTSARSCFAGPLFKFVDEKGGDVTVDHLKFLQTAVLRVQKAMSRTGNQTIQLP